MSTINNEVEFTSFTVIFHSSPLINFPIEVSQQPRFFVSQKSPKTPSLPLLYIPSSIRPLSSSIPPSFSSSPSPIPASAPSPFAYLLLHFPPPLLHLFLHPPLSFLDPSLPSIIPLSFLTPSLLSPYPLSLLFCSFSLFPTPFPRSLCPLAFPLESFLASSLYLSALNFPPDHFSSPLSSLFLPLLSFPPPLSSFTPFLSLPSLYICPLPSSSSLPSLPSLLFPFLPLLFLSPLLPSFTCYLLPLPSLSLPPCLHTLPLPPYHSIIYIDSAQSPKP